LLIRWHRERYWSTSAKLIGLVKASKVGHSHSTVTRNGVDHKPKPKCHSIVKAMRIIHSFERARDKGRSIYNKTRAMLGVHTVAVVTVVQVEGMESSVFNHSNGPGRNRDGTGASTHVNEPSRVTCDEGDAFSASFSNY